MGCEHPVVGMGHGKPVILAGNGDRAVLQVHHGLIRPPVAVAHLVGLQSRSQTHELVAQADPHHGQAVLDRTGEGVTGSRRLSRMCGVARTVAAEQGVDGVVLSQAIVVHVRRAPDDIEQHAQVTENVVLHAAVQHAEAWFCPAEFIKRPGVEFQRCIDGHFIHKILKLRRGEVGQHRLHVVLLLHGSEDAQYGSQFTNAAGDGPCVDVVDAGHAVKTQKFVHRSGRVSVVRLMHGVANHHALGPYLSRFRGPNMDAVIADQRVREGQNLTGKGGVGQRFLVAHHAGGEHQLARPDGLGAEQFTRIASSIGREQHPCPAGSGRQRSLV